MPSQRAEKSLQRVPRPAPAPRTGSHGPRPRPAQGQSTPQRVYKRGVMTCPAQGRVGGCWLFKWVPRAGPAARRSWSPPCTAAPTLLPFSPPPGRTPTPAAARARPQCTSPPVPPRPVRQSLSVVPRIAAPQGGSVWGRLVWQLPRIAAPPLPLIQEGWPLCITVGTTSHQGLYVSPSALVYPLLISLISSALCCAASLLERAELIPLLCRLPPPRHCTHPSLAAAQAAGARR